ncbi:outer membrane protein assembly factor BamD [Inmirania thermothiophila]|uniref:Outer membrane protein assembly factor BamD n=1 Tax=Inmirania thermothiophila TaxID=1750597 RepID=A0A3N1Y7A8_9GAMM|nr:outer membrane protein assembly factor BamD [Inmirania thermothiophila]ROR34704.1 Beta-barrel assembly machine subunit BamD [Inmirania thermothiophila]
MRPLARLLPLLVAVLALAGCASLKSADPTRDWSAQRFYEEARSALDAGDYERAIELYEKLEARYPFGPYAQQAALEVAYAYYKFDEPDSAIAAADRFIRTYPRHPNVAYAYYIKGLANFNRGVGILDRYLGDAISERDPRTAREAFAAFAELVRRFPESRYAEDARRRMLYLRNALAAHEVQVAAFYLERKAYVAAAGRARYVIEHYPRSPAVGPALRILRDAYRGMGMEDLARDAERVLEANPAYRDVELGP